MTTRGTRCPAAPARRRWLPGADRSIADCPELLAFHQAHFIVCSESTTPSPPSAGELALSLRTRASVVRPSILIDLILPW